MNDLDSIVKGDFPEGTFTLVESPPRDEKELLGFQFLFRKLKEDVCFYVYYGETNRDVEAKFRSHGMDISEAISKKNLYWIDTGNTSSGQNVINCDIENLNTVSLAIFQFIAAHEKQKIRALINLSPELMTKDPITIYRFVYMLTNLFRRHHSVTALFLINEGHTPEVVASIETLCDQVIEIKSIAKGVEKNNMIRIKSPESGSYHQFRIGSRGIELVN
jgi:KaiC/GvpD/RAD55 family RecA-like ATPase